MPGVSAILSTMATACIWEPQSGRSLWDARFKPGWLGCTGKFMLIRPYRPYQLWAEQRSLGSLRLEIPVPYGETDCWQDIFNMPGAQYIAEQVISMPAAPADPGGIVPTVGCMFRRYADMMRMDHCVSEEIEIFEFMWRFSVFSWCMYLHSGQGLEVHPQSQEPAVRLSGMQPVLQCGILGMDRRHDAVP